MHTFAMNCTVYESSFVGDALMQFCNGHGIVALHFCASPLFFRCTFEQCSPVQCMIVMVTFDFLVQLYLLPERKRNRKKGYGRIVAERPTGSRAGCQSASGGSRTPRPVRTTVRPKPTSHHADRQPDHCPLKEKGGLGGLLRELNLSSSVSPTRTSQLVPPKSKH